MSSSIPTEACFILNDNIEPREALFARTVEEYAEVNQNIPIAVTTLLHVVVSDLKEESYMYDIFGNIALYVRADEVADKHLELCERLGVDEHTPSIVFKDMIANHEEFIASTASLKVKIKERLAEVIAEDEKFVRIVNMYWGEGFQEDFWVTIRGFFCHDYVGRKTGEGQTWLVD